MEQVRLLFGRVFTDGLGLELHVPARHVDRMPTDRTVSMLAHADSPTTLGAAVSHGTSDSDSWLIAIPDPTPTAPFRLLWDVPNRSGTLETARREPVGTLPERVPEPTIIGGPPRARTPARSTAHTHTATLEPRPAPRSSSTPPARRTPDSPEQSIPPVVRGFQAPASYRSTWFPCLFHGSPRGPAATNSGVRSFLSGTHRRATGPRRASVTSAP